MRIRRSAQVENNDGRSPSGIEKKNIATIYMGQDPKPRVSENYTTKIASTTDTSNLTYGLNDDRTNYLGQLEEFGSLVPIIVL